ncbi:hypothetical protein EVAR_60675_1 [Eumeta japonica]|uniref:Uncharacterized protein n=1 Tax=Eumeta variegata TaxID=151549 RepID=A0A4C1ZX33_EUMVA|nr:hypothetical protein EVAR_60675_1 [Eumeta japonica]
MLDKAKNRQIVELTPKYLYAGEKLLFQKAQRDNFGDELRCIKKGEPIPKKSKLQKMCVELDKNDVMRATRRLDRHQGLDAESKQLVILDSKNRITELLIQNAHQKCMHGNHETIINGLRQKYNDKELLVCRSERAQTKRRDAAHLLLELEHIIHSHPLTPVEPDLNWEALTPNHFLIGRSCGVSPIGIFKITDADSHTRKVAQQLADEF